MRNFAKQIFIRSRFQMAFQKYLFISAGAIVFLAHEHHKLLNWVKQLFRTDLDQVSGLVEHLEQ